MSAAAISTFFAYSGGTGTGASAFDELELRNVRASTKSVALRGSGFSGGSSKLVDLELELERCAATNRPAAEVSCLRVAFFGKSDGIRGGATTVEAPLATFVG